MTAGATLATPESKLKQLERYVATNWHRAVAYTVTEALALFTLAHVQATSLEHEITVAGAAAIAGVVNRARAAHLIP